jgi:hypothetical protein
MIMMIDMGIDTSQKSRHPFKALCFRIACRSLLIFFSSLPEMPDAIATFSHAPPAVSPAPVGKQDPVKRHDSISVWQIRRN